MIGYWLLVLTNEIIEKSVTHKQTNRQTDRQTDRHIHESVYRVAPQLKSIKSIVAYTDIWVFTFISYNFSEEIWKNRKVTNIIIILSIGSCLTIQTGN